MSEFKPGDLVMWNYNGAISATSLLRKVGICVAVEKVKNNEDLIHVLFSNDGTAQLKSHSEWLFALAKKR